MLSASLNKTFPSFMNTCCVFSEHILRNSQPPRPHATTTTATTMSSSLPSDVQTTPHHSQTRLHVPMPIPSPAPGSLPRPFAGHHHYHPHPLPPPAHSQPLHQPTPAHTCGRHSMCTDHSYTCGGVRNSFGSYFTIYFKYKLHIPYWTAYFIDIIMM